MDTYTELSPLDHMFPPLNHAFILAFDSQSNDDEFFSILKTGLLKLAEQHPSLAKEVKRNDFNHLVFGQSTFEIPFIRKDLTQTTSGWTVSYEQLKTAGMAFTEADVKILAPLTWAIGAPHPMSAQINFIPGGKLLSVCFSHTFVDGHGASLIMWSWAKLCRGLQQNPVVGLKGNGTHGGKNPVVTLAKTTDMKYEKLKTRPELWELLCLDSKASGGLQVEAELAVEPTQSTAPPKVISKLFSFTETDLRNLKKKATSSVTSHRQAWISTHDALMAFLWRHIVRSRIPVSERDTGEKSNIHLAVNGRNTLSIPETHIGDVVFASVSSLPLQDLLSTKTSLSNLAQTIRMDVNRTKSTPILTDALALASCIPDEMLQSLRSCFDDMYAKNLVTSSWVDFSYYEMDWGLAFGNGGYIDVFRIMEGFFAGMALILPRKRDGTVEVLLGSKEEQMERLMDDEEFLAVAKLVW